MEYQSVQKTYSKIKKNLFLIQTFHFLNLWTYIILIWCRKHTHCIIAKTKSLKLPENIYIYFSIVYCNRDGINKLDRRLKSGNILLYFTALCRSAHAPTQVATPSEAIAPFYHGIWFYVHSCRLERLPGLGPYPLIAKLML